MKETKLYRTFYSRVHMFVMNHMLLIGEKYYIQIDIRFHLQKLVSVQQ